MQTPLEQIKIKREEAIKNLKNKGYYSRIRVYIGMATCEIAAGSKDVMEVFQNALNTGLKDVYVSQKGCAGRCNLEPTIEIVEQGKTAVKYGKVTKQRAEEIIKRHIINGETIQEWTI